MVNTILGRKLGMTQVWDENDNVVPVTVVLAGPCTVSQVKTVETDGYNAVQIGFGDISEKHVNKPMAGHFKAQGVEPMRYLREVRVEDASEHKTGDVVTVADFSEVTAVDVTGTSKGKGFQGTVKRWNFSRGPMTHGSRNQRRPGSIGQCAYPARVRKGLHMYGHMGAERVTVKNLKLVRVDAEQNLMLIKGAVPGGKNALVQVRMARTHPHVRVPTLQRTVTRYPAVALSLTVRRVLVVLARVLFVLVSGLVVASSLDLPLVHTHVVLTTRWSSLL